MIWSKSKGAPSPTHKAVGRQSHSVPPGAFPIRNKELLLEDEKALLSRIRLTSGSSNETFKKLYIPILEGHAEFVQALPASRAKHHFETGGLWQYSLEVALLSLQTADSKIFSGAEPVELRHIIEPRWRFAAFCAGLLLDIGMVISHMRVLSPKGDIWLPLQQSLYSWCEEVGVDHYYVQWLPEEQGLPERQYRMFSGVLANRFLPREVMTYLYEGNASILHEFTLALSGLSTSQSQNTLLQIIDQSKNSSIERDVKSRSGFAPAGTIGLPLETYLLDAMRHLVHQRWGINTSGSPLWLSHQGLFVCWEKAVIDILAYLEDVGFYTVPKMPSTLADIMLAHKLAIQPTPHRPHDYYWIIEVPGLGQVAALLLSSPELIINVQDMPVVEIKIISPNQPERELKPLEAAAKSIIENPQKNTISITRENDNKELVSLRTDQKTARTEDDLAPDTVLTAGVTPKKNLVSQMTPEESIAWLRKQGKAGEILAALAEDCITGRKRPGIDVFWMDVGLAIIFPNALMGLGFDPAKALSAIRDKGWVVANPKTTKSALHDISNANGIQTKALILTPSIGFLIAAVAGIEHPASKGSPVPSADGKPADNNQQKNSFKPKNFFDALAIAAKEGKISFGLSVSGEGVKASYPDVFEWYAGLQNTPDFKEIAMLLTKKDYVIFRGAHAVIKESEDRKHVVFRRDYCPELYAWLSSHEGVHA